MSSVVTVLTPNGRRQNVKVEPNKTVLQILDEVCQKHNFQSSEYDLRHHKRILDLSLMFRFTGLPNNAQLEMVKVLKQRQVSDVLLMIQFEDGSRKSDSFQPEVTLIDVLQKLCPEKCSEDDLVLIYMRTDIHGSDLSTTTLKSLGLTGGRAMFRLVQRKLDSLKTQANVSRVITVGYSANAEESNTILKSFPRRSYAVEESKSAVNDPEYMTSDLERKDHTQSSESMNRKRAKFDNITDVEKNPSTSNDPVEALKPISAHMEVMEEPEVNEIGERQAILFSLDSSTQNVVTDEEIKDSFFDLTVNDIKILLRDLRTQTDELENAPLMTTKMRELDHDNQTMLKLNRYRATVIRIQFPNRLVLQGIFLPSDAIQQVMDFVRNFLTAPNLDFYLYITPPKNVLNRDTTLVENHCVPMALLHFGTNEICDPNYNFLRDEFISKMSTHKAAIWAASKSRGLSFNIASADESESSTTVSSNAKQSHAKSSANFITSSAVLNTGTKLPKWLKPTGK